MHNERGLIRLAAIVFAAILGLGAVAWGTGLGAEGPRGSKAERRAEAASPRSQRAEGAAPRSGAGGDVAVCRVDGEPAALPDAVHEASGVALSRRTEGVLWTHADSGEPEVVAVSADGTERGTVRVAGARVEDWEDISTGPCAAGLCLFVADIGDNDASRERITVYRFPEPEPGAGTSAPAEALHATYPDGPQDAEALFVDAKGRIHVVTKGETGPVTVYRFPASAGTASVARLERVVALSTSKVGRAERITGADVSPDGRWVALRTLGTVSFHSAEALTAGSADAAARFDVTGAREPQGEGIALGEGGAVYLASEGGKKKNPATLTRLACPAPN